MISCWRTRQNPVGLKICFKMIDISLKYSFVFCIFRKIVDLVTRNWQYFRESLRIQFDSTCSLCSFTMWEISTFPSNYVQDELVLKKLKLSIYPSPAQFSADHTMPAHSYGIKYFNRYKLSLEKHMQVEFLKYENVSHGIIQRGISFFFVDKSFFNKLSHSVINYNQVQNIENRIL